MFKYLIPRIACADLPAMIWVSLIGAVVAGGYGIIHDQVTYSISPEFFSKLKFYQFDYADFGFGDRIFAALVGFLATWWAGLFVAWFLARRLIPGQSRAHAYRQIRSGFSCVFVTAMSAGLLGYFYGLWRGPEGDYSAFEEAFYALRIDDTWSFIRVAYIHNASYLGGLLGLIIALATIHPVTQSLQTNKPIRT